MEKRDFKHYAIKMIFQLVEQFIRSSKFKIKPSYDKRTQSSYCHDENE